MKLFQKLPQNQKRKRDKKVTILVLYPVSADQTATAKTISTQYNLLIQHQKRTLRTHTVIRAHHHPSPAVLYSRPLFLRGHYYDRPSYFDVNLLALIVAAATLLWREINASELRTVCCAPSKRRGTNETLPITTAGPKKKTR